MSEEKENLYPEVKDHSNPNFSVLFKIISNNIFNLNLTAETEEKKSKNKYYSSLKKDFWLPPIVSEYLDINCNIVNLNVSGNSSNGVAMVVFPKLLSKLNFRYILGPYFLMQNHTFMIKPILSNSSSNDFGLYYGVSKGLHLYSLDTFEHVSQNTEFNYCPPEVSIGVINAILQCDR